jgi:hypothetical protein
MSENFEPTREQIERRAYEIYVERGYEHGGDVEDWLAAEEQLSRPAPEVLDEREAAPEPAQGDYRRVAEQPDDSSASLRKKATAVGSSLAA